MHEGRLQVNMLGGFEMRFEGTPLQLKKRLTSKPVVLLQLLLFNRESGVTRRTVMEALFGGESEIDADNSLNATVSQLRKILRESGLPEGNYIHFRLNRYCFEAPFSVGIDTEEVVELRKLADLMRGEDRIRVLYQLCDIYQGRFLPELDGEGWVEIARANLQRIYKDSLTEVCRALEESRSFGEMLRLSTYAASMFPFDEWQVWQQKALLSEGRVREAHELYRQVEKLYLSEMDAPPPDRMRLRLQKPEKDVWRSTENNATIRRWLDRELTDTAMCVPYASFLYVYRAMHHAERESGLHFRMVLVSLSGVYGKAPVKDKDFMNAMGKLEFILSGYLRTEDIYTRLSRGQFLLILPGENRDSAAEIREKISAELKTMVSSARLTLECTEVEEY